MKHYPPAGPNCRGILVIVEQRERVAKNISWQLLGFGRQIADRLGAPLMALVLGHKVRYLAHEAVQYGADRVYLCDAEILEAYRTQPYHQVCLDLIIGIRPQMVLFGATSNSEDLAGATASHFPINIIKVSTEMGEGLCSKIMPPGRPSISSRLMEAVFDKQYCPQIAIVGEGVFQALPRDEGRGGEIIRIPFVFSRHACTTTGIIDFIPHKGTMKLEEANIIVAGGRGLGGAEGLRLIGELADALEGEVGGSRAAVTAGWMYREQQIGQTGSKVRPRLLFVIGISGAAQFNAGTQGSSLIIAINKDAHAPIFRTAHYGIVGDLFEIVPSLTMEARRRRRKM